MYYFDNAATTYPKPDGVYDFMNSFYRDYGVNVSRGQYKDASIAANIVRETRDLVLNLFHANGDYETVFTPSSTIAMNTILFGQNWNENDVVFITRFEHNAVLRTLEQIKRRYNIKIKYIEPDKNSLEYDLNAIKTQFIIDKPKLVVMNHASNSFGFIFPIEDVSKLAHEVSAKTVIDMSQTAGLIDTTIVNHFNYVIFAGHKTLYAPTGIAGFVLKKTDEITPFIYGGTGIDSANIDMPANLPERLEAGSPNIMAIAGLNASLKWINDISINAIFDKERENFDKLLQILSKYNNIKTFVHPNFKQIGIIASIFDTYPCENIGIVMSEHDIAVRTGLHCAPDSHKYMGTYPSGTVRFSPSYFTGDDDFEKLNEVLNYIKENT